MRAIIDSLPRNLVALRHFVSQQQERVALTRARDYANNRANGARAGLEIPPSAEPSLRQEAARLTARLRRLPRGNRSLRRAAEHAPRKAEKTPRADFFVAG